MVARRFECIFTVYSFYACHYYLYTIGTTVCTHVSHHIVSQAVLHSALNSSGVPNSQGTYRTWMWAFSRHRFAPQHPLALGARWWGRKTVTVSSLGRPPQFWRFLANIPPNSVWNVPEHPATGLVVCNRAWPPTLGSCTTSNALTTRLCELVQRLFFGAGRVFAL